MEIKGCKKNMEKIIILQNQKIHSGVRVDAEIPLNRNYDQKNHYDNNLIRHRGYVQKTYNQKNHHLQKCHQGVLPAVVRNPEANFCREYFYCCLAY